MISGIFGIIGALLPIVLNCLQGFKVISPTTGALITGVEGAAQTVTTALTTPGATGTPSATVLTVLGAISAALSVLKMELPADGSASKVLIYVTALESAIAAGVAAASITVVDPSQLKPVEAA